MSQVNDLIQRLELCPGGRAGWSQFEDICTEVLNFLLVPPLNTATRQARTYSGVNRRDAIISNRNNITPSTIDNSKNWHHLYLELEARMILFEFKNYKSTEIGHEEVNQTRNYMTAAMGKLAIMVCNKLPNDSAHRQRNMVYNQDGKVIIFITSKQLKEMLLIKERNEDPSDLIMDLIERFYIQHE